MKKLSYLGSEHFSVIFFGDSVVFVPDPEFVGKSTFILVADTEDLHVVSNAFTIEVKDALTSVGSVVVLEEKITQLRAEIGKPVKFRKDLVLFNLDDNSARSIDVYALFGGNMTLDERLRVPFGERQVSIEPLRVQPATLFFEKDPPHVNESETRVNASWQKRIVISSPEHYTEVGVMVNVTPARQDQFRLYHVIDGTRVDVTQNETYHITGFDANQDGLLEQLRWIIPHLSEQVFEVSVNITILNVQSYPAVGGVWEVYFNTTGTSDLWISGFNGTVFGKDLEFLSLRCGIETVQAITLNNSFLFRDFSCAQTGIEQSLVMTPGEHTLEFQFGNDVKYAFNNASINNTNANVTISDTTDSTVRYPGNQVEFFTTYINSTGQAINGSNVACQIRINNGSNNGVTNLTNMTFDATDGRYEFNRTFYSSGQYVWNVSCNGTVQGYGVLVANDTVYLNKSVILTYINRTHVINSFRLTRNVTVDGNPCTDAACASSLEWNDSLSNPRSIMDIDNNLTGDMQVRVKHDDDYLYVFVDFIVDTSNQVDDFVNVVIDTNNDGWYAPQRDDYRFERSGGASATTKVFRGNTSGWVDVSANITNWTAKHAAGASPAVSTNHLTFEYKINMTELNSSVNSTVGFMVHGYGLPSANGNTYWPAIGVETDANDYDIPGFNYTTSQGSSSNPINTLPDSWGSLVPNMVIPTTFVNSFVRDNMTIHQLHNVVYSTEHIVSIVGGITGNSSETSISRAAANSDKSLGARHNKTTQLFVGDNPDLFTKDDQRILKDFLSLNRLMFLYNVSSQRKNLTTASANTSSCSVTSNSSVSSTVTCTISNDDTEMRIDYSLLANNTHVSMFITAKNTGTLNITVIGFYNYFDYDLTKTAGSETQDDFYAIIQHTNNVTETEQINKEGQVVCDAAGEPNAVDLTKCSEAVNDTFFLRQSKGTGEAGGEILATEIAKFTPTSVLSFFIGFANPSTDTDGLREIPSEMLNVTNPGLMNKADLAAAIQVLGTTLKPNEKFAKYFALSTATTTTNLVTTVNEVVPEAIVDILVGSPYMTRNGTLTPNISQAGAYDPLHMLTEIANRGFIDLNLTFLCNLTAPSGNVVLSGNYTFIITADAPVQTVYCGGTNQTDPYFFNQNNSLEPGNYSYFLFATGTSTSDAALTDSASANFTILTDYVGNLTITLDNGLKTCNELVNITVNVTNRGNTNFTGNVTIDLFYADPNVTFYQNLVNKSITVLKDNFNLTSVAKNITECPFNRTYIVRANFTTVDEANGTEIRNDSDAYTFPLWAFYFGQILGNLTLRTPANRTLFYWQFTNFTGNIFVADADSQINWLSLFPIGIKNDSVTIAANDFNETDLVLNITETRNDSIMDLFSSNGTHALNFSSFNIFGRLLNNASVAQSTNTSNYLTSMLWDMSDSTDTEFNLTEREDLVFVSQILVNKTTINGTYDYEIRVPSKLNTYKGTTEAVAFYAQLT